MLIFQISIDADAIFYFFVYLLEFVYLFAVNRKHALLSRLLSIIDERTFQSQRKILYDIENE